MNTINGLITQNIYTPISKDEIKKNKKRFFFLTLMIIYILIVIIIFIFFSKNNLIKMKILSKKSIKTTKISNEFTNNLKKILKNDELIENEIMSKHTTFRIGGPAKFFTIPKTINQIIEIIKLCNKYNVNYFILGNGSNLLVSDNGYYGVIILIHEKNFSNLEINKHKEYYILKVGGGMLMRTLAIESCLLSLTGLEDIIDIPGTIGGGIIMRASFRTSGLKKPLLKVKVITSKGEILELTKKECKLGNRGSMLKDKKYLVIEAVFNLTKGDQMIIQKTMTNNTKMRYDNHPMYFGSAGCFFVWNHTKYGSLYQKYKESNLISYRIGNAMIYTYCIAFIVNLGKAKAQHVMDIVTLIEKIMKEKYNIEMKREVVVIGSFKNIEYY